METLQNPTVDLQHYHRGFLWSWIKQQGSFSHSLPTPALKPCLQVRILGLPSGGQPTLVPWDLSFLLLQRMTCRLYLHTLCLSPTTTRGNNEQLGKMAGEKGFHPLLCGAESSRSGLQTLKGIHRDKGQFGINPGVICSPQTLPLAVSFGFDTSRCLYGTPFPGPVPQGTSPPLPKQGIQTG